MDLSKIEAGHFSLKECEFDLVTCVVEAMELFQLQAQEKGLVLFSVIDPDLEAAVLGDQGRLTQVLINLIGNALKFTDTGQIIVKVTRTGKQENRQEVCFEIIDTGIGIPEEIQEDLFQPFTQADESNTRKYGGTGLGLTICRQIISAMEGSLHVESEPGKGSRFYFYLSFILFDESEDCAMRVGGVST